LVVAKSLTGRLPGAGVRWPESWHHRLDFATVRGFTLDGKAGFIRELGRRTKEKDMSVPGRVGLILIIALALLDGLILASGAWKAATAIHAGGLTEIINPAWPIRPCCSVRGPEFRADSLRPAHVTIRPFWHRQGPPDSI
jgi:hypothetical protein